MPETNANLSIWSQLETTDPAYTKGFNRGGFRGTAINPNYVVRKLTELFGPCGMGWWFEIESEVYREGHVLSDGVTRAVVHVICGRLVYRDPQTGDAITTGPQYGQTMFVGEYSSGPFTDEEAPKKSLTDALGKCAALLGMSADIYSGKWDDNKYVNTPEAKAAKRPAKKRPAKKAAPAKSKPATAGPDDIPKLTPAIAPWEVNGTPTTANQWREILQGQPAEDMYAEFTIVAADRPADDAWWEGVCEVFADALRESGEIETDAGRKLLAALVAERETLDTPAAAEPEPEKPKPKRPAKKAKRPPKKATA